MSTKVPFYPLDRILKASAADLRSSFERILKSGQFILGEDVSSFEESFATFTGVSYCAGVSSGHDALVLSLKSLGISQGDEVLVSSNTFASSWLAIIEVGATPIPIDSDPLTRNLDLNLVESAISDRTKAVLVVHIYGRPCDMARLCDIARRFNIQVLEDCAQAHGATFDNKRVGGFSDLSSFSFYPTKILGCLGDGGAVCSDSENLVEHVKKIRNYGSTRRYLHDVLGGNSRLDNLQASFLNVRLGQLQSELNERAEIAQMYFDGLAATGIKLPPRDCEIFRSSWHLYVIEVENRDEVKSRLDMLGVETAIHYPNPLHKQKFYKDLLLEQSLNLPVTERICETCLSLPIWPSMNYEEVDHVVEQVNRVLSY